MNPKAISLFCGAGGCSLGFKQAGYSILYANDKDRSAVATYKENFPDTFCTCDDIGNIDFVEVMNQIEIKPGELDILIGGPPCQGFSTAGSRFWDDPRNHLLKSYISALKVIQPKWFMMENVEGLLTSNKGIYIQEAAKAFLEIGYHIRIEKIYAQEYGVPQRRKRVIVLGNRIGLKFDMPHPQEMASGRIFRKSSASLADAIEGLPLALVAECSHNPTDHCYREINGIQKERIKRLKQGQTMKDLPEHLQHDSFKRRANRRVADGTPTEKRGGAPSGLKRLYADEPCLTITGAATRELIHPTEDRPLTVREAARIQTFPDSFVFEGNASQKIQQIGNAIPPLLAKTFAEHILDAYGFDGHLGQKGILLGYLLTKAGAMSPALERTDRLLNQLAHRNEIQETLFGLL